MTSKKVLLFGAYANRNLGDQYQAQSVAGHFRRLAPEIEVFATSAAQAGGAFEFEPDKRFAGAEVIKDHGIVNGFDALVIGGGGLLHSKHRPLTDAGWVERVKIPIIILGVGAGEAIARECAPLLQKAAIVTARDAASLDVLRAHRPDATLLCDPILADPELDWTPGERDVRRLAVIPRKREAKFDPVFRMLNADMAEDDLLLSMFDSADRESRVPEVFDRFTLDSPPMMGEFLDKLRSAGGVFSFRYHGCILALKSGLPCLVPGCTPRSKIWELFDAVGHPHLHVAWGSAPKTERLRAMLANEVDSALIRARLDQMAQEFAAGFARIFGNGTSPGKIGPGDPPPSTFYTLDRSERIALTERAMRDGTYVA